MSEGKQNELNLILEILDSALEQIQEKNDRFSIDRFKGYQFDILKTMFINYLDNKHSILIAPTGSGKSLIGLLYSYCISKYHKLDGGVTILASDTFLQEQYIESNNFFTSHVKDSSFSMLKGKGQYTCNQNFQPYPKGICGTRKISAPKAFETMPCASGCDYVQSYMNAIDASIRVFNYHLFLSYANHVGEHVLLDGNHAMVFDECHKVDSILDGFANIKIGLNFLSNVTSTLSSVNLLKPEFETKFTEYADKAKALYSEFFRMVLTGGLVGPIKEKYLELLMHLKSIIVQNPEFSTFLYETLDAYKFEVSKNIELPFTIQALFDFDDFLYRVDKMFRDSQNITPDKFVVNYDSTDHSLTIANISTSDRFHQFIASHCDQPIVFMSATVGNAEYYAKHLGLMQQEVEVIDVKSMFDFSKSPIVTVNPLMSLNPSVKDDNLPKLMNYIDIIMNTHKDHNGVIHTANKELATYISKNIAKHNQERLLLYTNAQEKKDIVKQLSKDTNKVIVAYSMEEGVDFKDDLCRFQIIAKLSWAFLGDYTVKRKKDVYPEWYLMETLNKLLQTFGRGNRHIDDYCINYILDSSFNRLGDMLDDITKERLLQLFYDQINVDFVNKTFKIEKTAEI